jgi:hypothetical protein
MVEYQELPPLDELNHLFQEKDGVLYRKGKVAGWVDSKGYIKIEINGKQFLAHRLLWKMHYGEDPKGYIDHIDRNPRNNLIDNLRIATHSVNMHNRSARGYYYNKVAKKFQAYLRIDKRMKSLGYYDNEEQARDAYISAKQKFMSSVAERAE